METKIDIRLVYETILSAPGMDEKVKVDLRISRKAVLLLSQAVESGLKGLGQDAVFLDFASKESHDEVEKAITDCLQKSGLSNLDERLKTITNT